MDYKEVEQLLDKFYNAHTTCPEEQKLYDWLCSEECSEELFIDREIIRTYIQQHPPVDIPKDIELKMEVLIDQWADSEHQSIRKKIIPEMEIHSRNCCYSSISHRSYILFSFASERSLCRHLSNTGRGLRRSPKSIVSNF